MVDDEVFRRNINAVLKVIAPEWRVEEFESPGRFKLINEDGCYLEAEAEEMAGCDAAVYRAAARLIETIAPEWFLQALDCDGNLCAEHGPNVLGVELPGVSLTLGIE